MLNTLVLIVISFLYLCIRLTWPLFLPISNISSFPCCSETFVCVFFNLLFVLINMYLWSLVWSCCYFFEFWIFDFYCSLSYIRYKADFTCLLDVFSIAFSVSISFLFCGAFLLLVALVLLPLLLLLLVLLLVVVVGLMVVMVVVLGLLLFVRVSWGWCSL